MNSREVTRKDGLILGAVLLLACALRFYKLDAPLWHDEIYTVLYYIRLSLSDIVRDFGFNNHVFYSLQSKATVLLFGESNWSIRLPAALFGVASIAAMWWLARLVAGIWQAHVTALLLTLSYHHVWFSQNARGYTEIAFWCTLATIFFISGLRSPNWRTWLAYGLAIAAALYTHLTAGFTIAAHGLVYFGMLVARLTVSDPNEKSLVAPQSLRENLMVISGFAVGGLLVIVLYAPALVQVIENVFAVAGTSEVDVMQEYQNPLWTIAEALRTISGPGLFALIMGLGVLLTVAIGSVSIARHEPAFPAIVWVHIPLTIALLLFLSMRIWPRFFFVDIGFLFLLITQGVWISCQFISNKARDWLSLDVRMRDIFAMSVVAMTLLSVGLLIRNYQYPKQNLEGAYRLVEAHRLEGDAIITLGPSAEPFADYFNADWSIITTHDELLEIERTFKRVWVVAAFPARTFRRYGEIMSDVDARYELEHRFVGTLGDGNVLVYRRSDN